MGATLAVGHAQGGPRGWLAGRLSAAAEVAPGPQMARAPQAPARIEPVAPSPSLDRAAPSDPPAAGAPRESDLSAGANLAKVAEAPALAPSLRPVIAAGFPRAAPGRRGLDRPSPATTDRAGQRFEVRRRVSLAPTEPPPLGPGPVESTESRGASAVPESAPFTTEASPGAAPATRRPPAAEDATLPLDEAGGDPDDNRPLGLTE